MTRHYTVVFEPGDNGWIVARVPELPGAMSQGRTMEEAREMIADAVSLLLQTYHEEARKEASRGAVWDTVTVELPAA